METVSGIGAFLSGRIELWEPATVMLQSQSWHLIQTELAL
jgi:hypothetical protein